MRFKNIVFCSPSMITGGAEYYNVRLAQYLANKQKEYSVYYIEYIEGFSHKVMNDPNIKYLNYVDNNKTEIPEDSIVCLPSNLLYRVEDMIDYNKNNSILTIFFAHAKHFSAFFSIGDYFKVGKKTRYEVGQCFEKMAGLGTLIFMDNISCLKLSQQFLFPYRPRTTVHVPIHVEKYGVDFKIEQKIGDVIRFCWLGRLDEEKALNIITYMNELEMINKKIKVSLSVIGLGPAEHNLHNVAKKYSYPIYFIGEKRELELDSYIRQNVDIGLASGTSALEFAIRKVPVIQEWVIDRIYTAGKRDTYHLIENMEKIIGVTESSHRIEGQNKFELIANQIIDNYHNQCEIAYNYALSRSLNNTGKDFVAAMQSLETVDIDEAHEYLCKAQRMARESREIDKYLAWFHLGRLFIICCKLLGVKPIS